MRVSRRSEDEDAWDEPALAGFGTASSYPHPWDWDDETAQQLADELEEALARKRPAGFAPWPENGLQGVREGSERLRFRPLASRKRKPQADS